MIARAQQPLGEHDRADHVVGHDASGVADDVRVAVGEAEHLEDVHAAVHAGDDDQSPPRVQLEVLVGVGASEAGVVGHQLVGVGGEAVLTSVHEPDGIRG